MGGITPRNFSGRSVLRPYGGNTRAAWRGRMMRGGEIFRGDCDRRDAGNAEDRVEQCAIFGAQPVNFGTLPRDFRFQRAGVTRGRNSLPNPSKCHPQPQTVVICRKSMSRYSTHAEAGKLVVIFPRRSKAAPLVLFFACILFAAYAFWQETRGFDVFVRGGFAALLVVVFGGWLWVVAGQQELVFASTELRHRRALLGLSHTKAYKMKDIQAPRFVEALDKARLGSRHPSGIGFSCKGKNVSLCNGITQTEAKQIVGAVLHQFPELTQIWGHYAEGAPTTTEYVSLNLK